MTRYLVLVETASNQRYVFASNVFREALGASRLLALVGMGWFPEAVLETGGDLLIAASGKGMASVADQATGERIVSAVCEKVLKEAPGLCVYGSVVPVEGEDADALDAAIGAAHREMGALRGRLGQAQTALMLPVAAPCRSTGKAAVGFDTARKTPDDQKGFPFSREALAKRRARSDAIERIEAGNDAFHDFLIKGENGEPDIDLDLNDNGKAQWVAVIHADGNDLGRTIREFLEKSGLTGGTEQAYRNAYKAFSEALDECCRRATRTALRAIWGEAGRPNDFFFKPLLVAGDDLTVLCEGRHGLTFARTFLDAFAAETKQHDGIKKVCPEGISAGAGIAIVKPHYPFHRACNLATDLADGAKERAKTLVEAYDPPPSLLDFRVVIDGSLDVEGSPPRAGPYILGPAREDVCPLDTLATAREVLTASGENALPRGQQHALREAATRGQKAADDALRLIRHRYDFPWSVIESNEKELSVGLLFDALALVQVDRAEGGA